MGRDIDYTAMCRCVYAKALDIIFIKHDLGDIAFEIENMISSIKLTTDI